jgi:NAD dependent epimerase/dehydratase family enzyme
VPAWVLRRLPGGMSDMFLHSQRVVPAAAMNAGFSWNCPAIEIALQRACGPTLADAEPAQA